MTVSDGDRDVASELSDLLHHDDSATIQDFATIIARHREQATRELVEQIELDRNTFRDCDIINDPIGAAVELEAAMKNCDAILAKYGARP